MENQVLFIMSSLTHSWIVILQIRSESMAFVWCNEGAKKAGAELCQAQVKLNLVELQFVLINK